MINITLPDGSGQTSCRRCQRDRDWTWRATSAKGLARNVLAAEVDGEVRDAQRPLGG